MRVRESTKRMVLPDPRVWVCGDWHGNAGWLQTVLPAMHRLDRGISTVLHAGDWWMDPESVDYWSERAGIERILVTLGNHEPYDKYAPLLDAHPGEAVRISSVIWLLPRPWRFEAFGREFLSLGGAASVDRRWRTEGKDWWPAERITDEHVEAARIGPADVMITHESPDPTPVPEVAALLALNPHGFPADALAESQVSRSQVSRAWESVRPNLLIHGHMHVAGTGKSGDDLRVVSLGRDTQEGNVALLDLATLSVELPSLRTLRGW